MDQTHTHNESCSPELCGGYCLAACNPSLHAIFNKMLRSWALNKMAMAAVSMIKDYCSNL